MLVIEIGEAGSAQDAEPPNRPRNRSILSNRNLVYFSLCSSLTSSTKAVSPFLPRPKPTIKHAPHTESVSPINGLDVTAVEIAAP